MTRAPSVLVVGAGPAGLALALQAHAHGARVRVIERRQEASRPSRALILHPRTLEVLRPLGVTDALLGRAEIAPAARLHLGAHVAHTSLANLALPDTAFPHLTLIRQMAVEEVLERALAERGAAVERGSELLDLREQGTGLWATLRTPSGIDETAYDFVAGCDGPESTVRGLAGIGWAGGTYRQEAVLADVELAGSLAQGEAHVVVGSDGLLFLFALGERATWRLLATRLAEHDLVPFGGPGPVVPLAELETMLAHASLDARITKLVWSARYPLQHRLATHFRRGRLFLVGDAAHAFSPATGQGMNTAIQDALNLGWKLAFAAGPHAPLLDSYELERRPADRRLLALTHLVFWAEAGSGRLPRLLRGGLAPRLVWAAPVVLARRRLIARLMRGVSQLSLAYPASPLSMDGTPRLRAGPRPGRRLPDAIVCADGRRVRLHALLAQPGVHLLLQRDASSDQLTLGPRITLHHLTSWPGRGVVAIRPDGYVGFRCGVVDPVQLRAWLERVGADAASGAVWLA